MKQLRLSSVSRQQLGALVGELKDLDLSQLKTAKEHQAAVDQCRGNQNRIIGDEQGNISPLARNGIAERLRNFAEVGFARGDEEQFIDSVLSALQTNWGAQIVEPELFSRLAKTTEFAVGKATQLTRMGLHPGQVTEHFVSATGQVDGEKIKDRQLFLQRYAPAPEDANGKVIVLSPGFAETGRHFESQIGALVKEGYDVVTLDHQWAGRSDGEKGGFDSVKGLARDVAAATVFAQQIQRDNYPQKAGSEVMLFGNSMGALAALTAASMNQADKLQLGELKVGQGLKEKDQALPGQMQKGLKLMLQSPFMGMTDNVLNKALQLTAGFRGINKLALPAMNLPVITTDPLVQKLNAQEGISEGITSRPLSLKKVVDDLEKLWPFFAQNPPGNSVGIYHQTGDLLANYQDTQRLAEQLTRQLGSDKVAFMAEKGFDHVVENDPESFLTPLAVLDRVASGKIEDGKVNAGNSPWHQAVANNAQALGGDQAQIGWTERFGKAKADITADFREVFGAVKAGLNELPEKAKELVYVHVPGLFTERYPGYMDDNLGRLQDKGLDARKLNIDTDAGVMINAKSIRDQVMKIAQETGKKVMLLGHSKGGVDISAALAIYPELKAHVNQVIAMQAPFGGSPVASDIKGCPELLPLASNLIESLFGGQGEALTDLSHQSRQQLLEKYPYPQDVPTISLATSSSSPWSLTAASAAYIKQRYGVESDGLVAVKDAILPGSEVIQLSDMDHSAPTMAGPAWCKYQPGDLSEALITLALRN